MRLSELEPRWIYKDKLFAFRCPHCRTTWLTCKRVPMSRTQQSELICAAFGEDQEHEVVGCNQDASWKWSGADFNTMTITSSIDASASGHWHGHVTAGAIVGGI